MKKWFLEHKKPLVLSVIGTLLPVIVGLILWNQLPDTMVTHWGVSGADGVSGKAFAVFGLPAILAVLDVLGFLFTAADPRQNDQNKKAMGMIFWIMPLLSWGVCSTMYAVAMGKTMDVFVIMPLLMGVLFLLIGNYMPKVKQNATLGIKLSWTLRNEENWNKTHRLAGKLWVAGGLVMLVTMLLPAKWMVAVTLTTIVIMVVVPILYSYGIYKKHMQQGITYAAPPESKDNKKTTIVSIVMLIVIFAGVAVLMFTGDITYIAGEKSLKIEATYEKDAEILYSQMDSVEYRETFDIGARVWGYGSVKLSLGNFQNEALGDYTVYAYNSCKSMIVIHAGDKYLAFNAATAEETFELYQTLLEKVEK